MLGLSTLRVTRLRREGLLVRLKGYPSYSRLDVEAFVDNPWLNGRQAAVVLGVSHNRVSQLAAEERIPVHHTTSGHRAYRMKQLTVVANARATRFAMSGTQALVRHTMGQ